MNDRLADPPVPMWSGPVPGQATQWPLVWLIGAHGGAASSTLSASLGFAGDAGGRWPGHIGLAAGLDSPLMVLVARTHMTGLAALHRSLLAHLHEATPVGTHLLGVVTVADSDRPLSTPAAARRDTVESLTRDLGGLPWRLGWIEPWRSLEAHQLPAWTPDMVGSGRGDRDATRAPPAPVCGLAEVMFAAARSAGAVLNRQARNRSGDPGR
ncbi:hypothetical protein [Nocardia brasiliensis]|uniref:hypothetical protein n=1 Tax=Nocardia brasiliensis TaxID=37326 RepID=UPI003D8DD847